MHHSALKIQRYLSLKITQAIRDRMSKNLRQRSQTDADSWNELFDTQTGPAAVSFNDK